ncbi:MAG: ATP-dependent protease [Candidatus Tectimicrobiota bacterium]|nr:MAG: ATP-dependent protease [Candidatus Tectomicrobia bacterium]
MAEKNPAAAAAVRELTAEEARRTVDLSTLPFATTAELPPLTDLVGQERAVQALHTGLGMDQAGYHIFVCGLEGTEAQAQIVALLRQRAASLPTPGDWVYVHNFRNPDQPQALALEPGQGRRLQHDMERLVAHLREALPKAFREEAFEREQRELSEKYEREVRQLQEAFARFARERGFALQVDPMGNVLFIPLRGDRPMTPEEVQQLSEEQRRELGQREAEVLREFRNVMVRQRLLMQQLAEEVRQIERSFSAMIIAPMIGELKRRHPQAHVQRYLDAVQEHMLSHLDRFKERAPQPPPQLPLPLPPGEEPFLEYRINVLVDNSDTQGAPVIVEDTPTYKSLFGTIDRVVDPHGRLVTNFTRIKAGSLLRASGGFILFNLEDALTEPLVWKTLKRTMQSRQLKIEAYDPFALFTISALQPEPIPIQTKIVVTGHPWLYYLLYFLDPDFQHLFKIKADFGFDMARTAAHEASYAHFIARLCRDENLKHFDRSGVAAVIEYGMRRVEDQEKLASQFTVLADVVREASFLAAQEGAAVVGRRHVEQALQARTFRANRLEEKVRELILQGTVLIDTEGRRVGQVNGLSVIQLGDHTFGRPSRVTATAAMGRSGIINIEREARLSGSTHDKGVLILAGYLRQMYAQDKPLTLSASLCFEQSYSGVEGDSASSTELYALLSRLANLPVRQDLAVTGSVNQWGDIQAIGGVNEKIEGFYDVCTERGLTGTQGVIIPQANVRHLMLRPDVVEAIRAGRFHIYPITHVDQGLELLTGVPAGDVHTPGTVHYLVNARLQQLARDIVAFGERSVDGAKPAEASETGSAS